MVGAVDPTEFVERDGEAVQQLGPGKSDDDWFWNEFQRRLRELGLI